MRPWAGAGRGIQMARRDKNLFRLLLYTALCVSVTIVVVSTVLYVQFEQVLREQIGAEAANHLNQISYSAKIMNDSARLLANQLFRDPLVGRLMFYTEHDSVSLNASLTQLRSYRQSMPFIHSIYIYNGNAGVFYSASTAAANSIQPAATTYDDGILPIIHRWEDYDYFQPIARRIEVPTQGRAGLRQDRVYTYVMYTERRPNTTPRTAIVLNLSHAWMHETVVGLQDDPTASVIVLGPDSAPVFATESALSQFSDVFPAICVAAKESGPGRTSLVVGQGDARAFVTVVESEYTNWLFLSVRSYGAITARLRPLRAGIALISGVILVLAMALTLVLSNRAYRPIRNEIRSLCSRYAKESSRSTALSRRQYLRNFLENGAVDTRTTRDEANRMFRSLGIPVDLSQEVHVLLICIDDHRRFARVHSLSRQSDIKTQIQAAASRALSGFGGTGAFEVDDDNFAVLTNTSCVERKRLVATLERCIRELQADVRDRTPCTVSAFAATASADRGTSPPQVYRDLVDVSFVRVVERSECAIVYGEGVPDDRPEYSYSKQSECVLVDHLMNSRTNEAFDVLEGVLRDSAKSSYTSMIVAMQRLALAVDEALRTATRNGGADVRISVDSFVKSLGRAESLSDVESLFRELFGVVSTRLANKQQLKHDELIAQVEALVEENYRNPLYSVNDVAEAVAMSSGYLGRLYKRETGRSLAKYINDARLREAENRLATTDDTVTSIAAECGFSSDVYFYKVFKKFRHVTPKEYRDRRQRVPARLPADAR